MGACFNIIIEFNEEIFLHDIDFNLIRNCILTSSGIEFNVYYFRFNFCEHDDEHAVLEGIAKIIEYFKKQGITIKNICLDGLEYYLKRKWSERFYHGKKDNPFYTKNIDETDKVQMYTLEQFKDIKIIDADDLSNEKDLRELRKKYNYCPFTLPFYIRQKGMNFDDWKYSNPNQEYESKK